MKTSFTQQRGMVLVVSLILLLLLTILAITAATNSSLQQKMSNNAQEQNTAFQIAESGLARWLRLPDKWGLLDGDPEANGVEGDAGSYNIEDKVYLQGSVGTEQTRFYQFETISEALTAGGARARHEMGYLKRENPL